MYNKLKIILGLFILTSLVITSCIKDDFDQPEIPDPCKVVSGFTPNITAKGISDLFLLLDSVDGSAVRIFPDTNIVLEATVVSNDKAGNFYKVLYLEDATGTLNLSIEGSGLFNDYPVGQTVHLNLKGLTIEFDSWVSIYEVGMGTFIEDGAIKGIGRIPVSTLGNFLKNNGCTTELTPRVIDLLSINNDNIGRFVKLENVQFTSSDTGKTYADADSNPPQNISLYIEDCELNPIILRTSGYASFAALKTPSGKGTIVGIYTKYGEDYQILIRDTADVQMYGPRCGILPPELGGDFDHPVNIADATEYYGAADFWIQGFIVGTYVNDWSGTRFEDTAPFTNDAIVCIADAQGETDLDKMIFVQLDSGEVKDSTNLKDNPELIGKSIKYFGDRTSIEYLGHTAFENVEGYWLIDEDEGLKP